MNIKRIFECCFPQTINNIKITPKQISFDNKEKEASINEFDKKLEDTQTNTRSDKLDKTDRNLEEETKGFKSSMFMIEKSTINENIGPTKFPPFTPQEFRESIEDKSNNTNSPNQFERLKTKIDNNSIISFQSLHMVQNVNNYTLNNNYTEETLMDFVQNNKIIDDSDVKSSCELFLEELEGDILRNNKLLLNAYGLVNGARKAKDGVSFFGTQYKDNEGIIINDYILNIDMVGLGPVMFIIYYKKENKKFYLRSYRDKINPGFSLLLIKLDYNYIIRKREILAIGDLYFQIQNSYDHLEIIKLASKASPETINYSFLNDSDHVTIGRDKNCTINFIGNKSLSRINCTFEFDKNIQLWRVKDGNQNKQSTNGTWIFAAHSYEIHDKTIFKIGNSKLRITMT